jgi:hypothetical protein
MDYLPPGVIAGRDRAINHVIAYGQSLSSGWEGWPALSTAPRHDLLMLGDSVRPLSESDPAWRPVGEARFARLRATNQALDGRLLTDAEVAALPCDSATLGETVLEAAMYEWRYRMRLMSPPRLLLASSAGVGGRSLEALSKGATPELFQRLRDCARLASDLAAGDYSIAALLMLQGENNAWALNGATAETAPYKALFHRFLADFDADIVRDIAGQAAPPAVFLHQVGGAYATDAMGIAQAQLELALEGQRVFLAAPSYPFTDKGGHLDANGYRWLGAYFGRAMWRVLTLGEHWRPLHPLAARCSGTTLKVSFHVPTPPLRWGAVYQGHTARMLPDRGFTVCDADGLVAISAIDLEPYSVTLHLARVPGANAELRYADQSRSFGVGNLHDSETATALDQYQYDPNTGHRTEANIAEMVGRRYPLMNWCAAFRMKPISGN